MEAAKGVSSEWKTIRVDLWQAMNDALREAKQPADKPFMVRGFRLDSIGGGAAFDRVVLGRTEDDLAAEPAALDSKKAARP